MVKHYHSEWQWLLVYFQKQFRFLKFVTLFIHWAKELARGTPFSEETFCQWSPIWKAKRTSQKFQDRLKCTSCNRVSGSSLFRFFLILRWSNFGATKFIHVIGKVQKTCRYSDLASFIFSKGIFEGFLTILYNLEKQTESPFSRLLFCQGFLFSDSFFEAFHKSEKFHLKLIKTLQDAICYSSLSHRQ